MKSSPTREEIRELLHEMWPSLPFKHPLTVNETAAVAVTVIERIEAAEAEVARLKKKATKR